MRGYSDTFSNSASASVSASATASASARVILGGRPHQRGTKGVNQLEHTNSLFLANLFGVSKRGCPEVSLYTESSTLLIPNQILMSQLLFLHHIATLPITSLARETYEEMKKHNFPGLVKNLEMYLRDWKLEEVESFSKWSWKKEVKKRITEKNWRDLIQWSEKYGRSKTSSKILQGSHQS